MLSLILQPKFHLYCVFAFWILIFFSWFSSEGTWSCVDPRIYTAANKTEHHKGKYPFYAGRGPTSSVATSSKAQHKEIEAFVTAAFQESFESAP
ncbi:hypothetical protein C8J57DRAFT_1706993 [Mycena rebaudengoi]|nr:hypothetical protein C8J57DRAFT_1706993 [Mycena rebaudengoi]